MRTVFERVALYKEVWQTPLTTLAKKYVLSDNGLRKVCKALNIPLPTAGHWARVAAGHTIEPPTLPPSSGRDTFESNPPPQSSPNAVPEDAKWLEERIAFETHPENSCDVDPAPRRWHRVVIPLRASIRATVKELEASRRDEERQAKNPRLAHAPNFNGYEWRSFIHSGQVLVAPGASAMLRASLGTYERGLAILNALCFCAERRGFVVSHDEKRGRLALTQGEATVHVRLTEKLNDEWRQETRWGNKLENVKYKVPSGVLRIYVGHSYSEREYAESQDRPLEKRLNDVFVGVYRRVVREREDARETERRRRERAEAERLWAIAEAQRREEAARQEAERKKRQALVAEAESWRTAELIREYVRRSDVGQPADRPTSEHATWRAWALAVADDLDPTRRRIVS